jgi:hypothetical protein
MIPVIALLALSTGLTSFATFPLPKTASSSKWLATERARDIDHDHVSVSGSVVSSSGICRPVIGSYLTSTGTIWSVGRISIH